MDCTYAVYTLCPGASSGIGAATAVLFSRLGADLILMGRNEANLQRVAEQCAAEPGAKQVKHVKQTIQQVHVRCLS